MKTLTETLAAVTAILPETIRAHRSGRRVYVTACTADELRAVIGNVTAALTASGRKPKRQAIRGYGIAKDEHGNATACWCIAETPEEHHRYLMGGDAAR